MRVFPFLGAVVAASYFADRGRAIAPASQAAGEACISCKLYAPPVWDFGRVGDEPVVSALDFATDKAK